jgi:hypothetical protein
MERLSYGEELVPRSSSLGQAVSQGGGIVEEALSYLMALARQIQRPRWPLAQQWGTQPSNELAGRAGIRARKKRRI